jgi:thioredoxin-related protein
MGINKTIFVLDGASQAECERFKAELKNKQALSTIINRGIKIYELIDGQLYEVVQSLKEVKD